MADYSNEPTVVFWRKCAEVMLTYLPMVSVRNQWPGDTAKVYREFASTLNSIPKSNVDCELLTYVAGMVNLGFSCGNYYDSLALFIQQTQACNDRAQNSWSNIVNNIFDEGRGGYRNFLEGAMDVVGSIFENNSNYNNVQQFKDALVNEYAQLQSQFEKLQQSLDGIVGRLKNQYGEQYFNL